MQAAKAVPDERAEVVPQGQEPIHNRPVAA